MSTALLALAQAAPLLGCRDPRTARRRLEELGVPVLVLSGRVLVDEGDIMRARRARARPLDPAAPVRWAGVHLAPGTRLWDVRTQVSGAAPCDRPTPWHRRRGDSAMQAQPIHWHPLHPSTCPDTGGLAMPTWTNDDEGIPDTWVLTTPAEALGETRRPAGVDLFKLELSDRFPGSGLAEALRLYAWSTPALMPGQVPRSLREDPAEVERLADLLDAFMWAADR